MNWLKQIKPNTIETNKLFPKQGFTWFVPMAKGRWEFLKLVVRRQEDKIPITLDDLKNLYKIHVTKEYKEKNFRPWLLRTIGALVIDGFLKVSTRLNKTIMVELAKINEEDVFIQR